MPFFLSSIFANNINTNDIVEFKIQNTGTGEIVLSQGTQININKIA